MYCSIKRYIHFFETFNLVSGIKQHIPRKLIEKINTSVVCFLSLRTIVENSAFHTKPLSITLLLLCLLAKIKCSICSHQFIIWFLRTTLGQLVALCPCDQTVVGLNPRTAPVTTKVLLAYWLNAEKDFHMCCGVLLCDYKGSFYFNQVISILGIKYNFFILKCVKNSHSESV